MRDKANYRAANGRVQAVFSPHAHALTVAIARPPAADDGISLRGQRRYRIRTLGGAMVARPTRLPTTLTRTCEWAFLDSGFRRYDGACRE